LGDIYQDIQTLKINKKTYFRMKKTSPKIKTLINSHYH